MHAASGLLSSSVEVLAFFASRQFAPKIVALSVRFFRILSERSGRRKSEAPCTVHMIHTRYQVPGTRVKLVPRLNRCPQMDGPVRLPGKG